MVAMFGGGNPDGGTKLAYPLKCIIVPAGVVGGGAIPWKTGPLHPGGPPASVVCGGQSCKQFPYKCGNCNHTCKVYLAGKGQLKIR